jgi:hypothetical protein
MGNPKLTPFGYESDPTQVQKVLEKCNKLQFNIINAPIKPAPKTVQKRSPTSHIPTTATTAGGKKQTLVG